MSGEYGVNVAQRLPQAQIQRFAEEPATMLATIPHDLRAPLTRLWLHGEFFAGEEQRARLFRDADGIRVMLGGALSFFGNRRCCRKRSRRRS